MSAEAFRTGCDTPIKTLLASIERPVPPALEEVCAQHAPIACTLAETAVAHSCRVQEGEQHTRRFCPCSCAEGDKPKSQGEDAGKESGGKAEPKTGAHLAAASRAETCTRHRHVLRATPKTIALPP